jgi:integrase
MSYTKKGRVTIENVKNRVRLRWRDDSKVRTMSVGAESSLSAQLKAELVALMIGIDLENIPQTYDRSLDKYRLMITQGVIDSRMQPLTVADLFKAFYKHRTPDLEWASYSKWDALKNHLKPLEDKLASQINYQTADAFIKSFSTAVDTKRSYLALLKACWRFGIMRYDLQSNPWELIYLPRAEKPEPDPFNLDEVQRIVQGFHGKYHYAYVCCLLSLGSRPSEASALIWGDIDFETNAISISKALDGRGCSKSTKTRKSRLVPMPPSLKSILLAHRPEGWQSDGLVFPAKKGGKINLKAFLKNHWKPTLAQVGVRYRSTYKCRHTVWSHAIADLPIAEAAKLAGNLPSTLLRNYVGSVTLSEMPDLLRNAQAG